MVRARVRRFFSICASCLLQLLASTRFLHKGRPWFAIRRLAACAAALILVLFAQPRNPSHIALAASSGLVISQIYGGGGNSQAPFTHDFVEIYNGGAAPIALGGLSIQYTSGAGTGNFGSSSTVRTELPAVTLAPGGYFLVQEAGNAAVGSPLPTPDHVDNDGRSR